jgi:hypothetical protein
VKRSARRVFTAALMLASAGALHCGPLAVPSSEPFRPTRFDYDAFRGPRAADEVREPNYLPFMAQRFAALKGPGRLCRWDVTRFRSRLRTAANSIPR